VRRHEAESSGHKRKHAVVPEKRVQPQTDAAPSLAVKKPRARPKKKKAQDAGATESAKKAPSAYINFSQFARPALVAARPGISFSEVCF
jgi:hypothetical protein